MRDSRMPVSRPLITRPTARPLDSRGARLAAIGTSTWAATENRPVTKVPSTSAMKGEGIRPANPLTSRPSAASSIRPTVSLRRSSISPSGTRNSRPMAYDTWAQVTRMPAVLSLTCSAWAMELSSGWLK